MWKSTTIGGWHKHFRDLEGNILNFKIFFWHKYILQIVVCPNKFISTNNNSFNCQIFLLFYVVSVNLAQFTSLLTMHPIISSVTNHKCNWRKNNVCSDKKDNSTTIRDSRLIQDQGKTPQGGNTFKSSSLINRYKKISAKSTMSSIHMFAVDTNISNLQIYITVEINPDLPDHWGQLNPTDKPKIKTLDVLIKIICVHSKLSGCFLCHCVRAFVAAQTLLGRPCACI